MVQEQAANPHAPDLQWEIRRTFQLLRPHTAAGLRKVRVGSDGDGGYIMLDDFHSAGAAYSLGIGGNVAWDLAMAERGFQVFQYDHTVADPPTSHPNFHFHKKEIGPSDDGDVISITSAISANGHEAQRNLILKIDIECAEWVALDALPDTVLGQFEQIIGEFHGFLRIAEPDWRAVAQRVLGRLYRSHAVYHVHANNWGDFLPIANVPVADVLEISFVRRDRAKLVPSFEYFPSHLDMPCHPERPDIVLGSFIFR